MWEFFLSRGPSPPFGNVMFFRKKLWFILHFRTFFWGVSHVKNSKKWKWDSGRPPPLFFQNSHIFPFFFWQRPLCAAEFAKKKSDFVEYAATPVLFNPSACSWVHDSVIFTWLLIRLSNVTDVTQNKAFQTRPTTLLPLCPNISATSKPTARPCNCLNVENVT